MSNTVQVDAASLDLILRAYCQAELARVKYWVDTDDSDTHVFFTPAVAFWSEIVSHDGPLTDSEAIFECRRMWDSREVKRYPGNDERAKVPIPNVCLRDDRSPKDLGSGDEAEAEPEIRYFKIKESGSGKTFRGATIGEAAVAAAIEHFDEKKPEMN